MEFTTTREYVEALATGLAQENGVKIIKGTSWRCNVKARTLEYDEASLLSYPPLVTKGLILHETGHLLYTSDSRTTALQRAYPVMQLAYNAFEDIRIENKLIDKYGDFSLQAIASLNHGILSRPDKIQQFERMSKLEQYLFFTIIRACYSGMQSKYIDFSSIYRAYYDKLPADVLKASSFSPSINDIYPLADIDGLKSYVDTTIYPIIKPFIDELPKDKQEELVEKEKNGNKAGNGIGGTNPDKNGNTTLASDSELLGLLAPYIRTLSRDLRAILKEQKATRFTGSHYTGHLLGSHAYKIVTGESRIFSKKSNPNAPDYHFILCLDSSGSMHGDKHTDTYTGSLLLERVAHALNFPVTLIPFNDTARVVSSLNTGYRSNIGGNTLAEYALQEAIKCIQPKKDNLIFFLTDGRTSDISETIRIINQKYHTPVIGVGIGIPEGALDQSFNTKVIVQDVARLPLALVSLLKTVIHR